ncbi:MAG TPA: DUF6458 family protein [Candidatus Nanopelagicaceae bacterium]|nr:DUF6458 family protein [Candidatus Nanopelagicaceae bacterium]
MGIGFSIFLVAAGAILKYAVHATLGGLDIGVVGIILMVAGVAGLLLTMLVITPRRKRSITETSHVTSGGSGNAAPTTETMREVSETNGEGPVHLN